MDKQLPSGLPVSASVLGVGDNIMDTWFIDFPPRLSMPLACRLDTWPSPCSLIVTASGVRGWEELSSSRNLLAGSEKNERVERAMFTGGAAGLSGTKLGRAGFRTASGPFQRYLSHRKVL